MGDRPAVAHALGSLSSQTFADAALSSIVVNVHHLPDSFRAPLAGFARQLQFIHEPMLRGTAGGIAGARPLLTPPVLIWNGDILTQPPLHELLAVVAGGGVVLAVQPRALGEGPVGLDDTGRVVRLRNHVFGTETRGADYVGVAALGEDALGALPELGCLIADFAVPWLRAGRPIHTLVAPEPWYDIGDLAGYAQANRVWRRAHARQLDAQHNWRGAGSSLAPTVTLSETVLGERAQILGTGEVSGCIVWPDAVVRAPLSNSVVTTSGLVVPLA